MLARDPTLLRLTSNAHAFTSVKGSAVAQLFTSFDGGAGNKLIVGYSRIRDRRNAAVIAPQVQVDVPTVSGGTARLRAGAENSSQGTEVDQDVIELTDNYTVPLGRHRVTAGTQNELYRIRNLFAQNSYGVWEFSSLDSLARGDASRYQAGVGLGGPIDARFDAAQLGLYVQDRWQATDRFVLTAGLRLDVPFLFDKPQRTRRCWRSMAEAPTTCRRATCSSRRASVSTGIVSATVVEQMRGGVGLFVGRPAVRVARQRVSEFRNGTRPAHMRVEPVRCLASRRAVPHRRPRSARMARRRRRRATSRSCPRTCAFRSCPRVTRVRSIASVDAWIASVEAMYTRAMSTFFYTNLALAGLAGPRPERPRGVRNDRDDGRGRLPCSRGRAATSSTCRTRARITRTA